HLPSWAHTLVEEDRVLNRPGERALCSSVKAKEKESDWAACSMRIEGEKDGGEPDDAELVRLSKRLVENAVLKAVQQYLEETQNKKQLGEGSSVKIEEAERNGNDSDNNRK
ncbi:Hypothetical predicted protein, partial [Marmota monax]